MEITDKRTNRLIKKFKRGITKMGLDAVLEYTEYPGDIVWVTKKQLSPKYKGAVAYVVKVVEHGSTAGQIDIPLFKIVLVKEKVLKLSDTDFLAMLAHEYSHVLIGVKRKLGNIEEWMCDTLGEYFFGYKRKKGSLLGYMHDKEAFTKIYGKKKAEQIFKK